MEVYRFARCENEADRKTGGRGIYQVDRSMLAYRYTALPAQAKGYDEVCQNPWYDKGLKRCPVITRGDPWTRSIEPEYACGFSTPEQLLRWFPAENCAKMEREVGVGTGGQCQIALFVYHVPSDCVYIGELQALFDIDRAKVVEILPCDGLNPKPASLKAVA
jgi:hypothetical protein